MKSDCEEIIIANENQTEEIIKLLQTARDSGNVRIGSNESTKALNRGKAHIVVLAADTEPIEIIAHLPILCKDKDVLYFYVKSKDTLGKALGLTRNVIAVSVVSEMENDAKRIGNAVKKIIAAGASA
ncbi:hypothetical protein COBT_002178 [Conglomerata obtusa]